MSLMARARVEGCQGWALGGEDVEGSGLGELELVWTGGAGVGAGAVVVGVGVWVVEVEEGFSVEGALWVVESLGRRRVGKGASMMKFAWSVFSGPALSMGPVRRVGPGEPRARRAARTGERARGLISMGMVGQLVRRRAWSLRWSGAVRPV